MMLNYKDAVLYESDISLFDAPRWLNDACINFGFRELEREGVLLVDPAVVSYLLFQAEPEEIEEFRAQMPPIVLAPVNDALDFQSQGTHWSLVATFGDGSWLHYDSLGTTDGIAARRVVERLGGTTGPPRRVPTPPQENGYDCGVYVVATAQLLLLDGGEQPLERKLTPEFVSKTRVALARRARRLAADYKKDTTLLTRN